MNREERDAEIKRLQAKIDHNNKRIGQCIIMGAVVLIGGMFVVMILGAMGL